MSDWRGTRLTRESFERGLKYFVEASRRPPPERVEIVSPSEYRWRIRRECERLGWTHDEMRAYLGPGVPDPWRVKLPVVHCEECDPYAGLRTYTGELFGIK